LSGPIFALAQGAPTLTTNEQATFELYPATALTGPGTTNTDSPKTIRDIDASFTNGWASADVFIAATFGNTGTMTSTVQLSADGTNWVDAEFDYWTGSAIGQSTHQRVQTASGGKYMRIPLAGEFLRVVMAVSTEASTVITPSVTVTYRK